MNLSDTVRNARLDAIEVTVGVSPTLKIFSGSPPASCSLADSGNLLATLTLPSDWMNDASSGSKTLKGSWSETSADGSGDAGYFRIYSGAVCHIQGTVSVTAGAGEMQMNNISVVSGQQVTISAFTLTDGNS